MSSESRYKAASQSSSASFPDSTLLLPVSGALHEVKSGDNLLINGTIYTGRDAAHKRLVDLLEKGESLPFDITGQIIYFVGPTPARPGRPVGLTLK